MVGKMPILGNAVLLTPPKFFLCDAYFRFALAVFFEINLRQIAPVFRASGTTRKNQTVSEGTDN